MKDIFINSEWEELCERLMISARNHGSDEFVNQAVEFCAQEAPERYPDLLARVRDAAVLAQSWKDEIEEHRHEEELIDEALEESFPASDPPAFPATHL